MRRIFPVITLFLAFLLDTSVIPVLYHGPFTISLTLAVVLIISLRMGKLRGALFGMFAGMFADITAGSLPMMTMIMLATGALTSLLIPEYEIRKPRGRRVHFTRFLLAFGLHLVLEIALNFIAYYQTATIAGGLVWFILMRSLLFAAVTTMIAVPLTALYPTMTITKRDEKKEDERH